MKRLRLLAGMLLIFLLCGCQSYREVEEMGIVAGIAIDKGERYKYKVTAELVTPGENGSRPLVQQNEGDTVYEALSGISGPLGQKLYFSHCRVCVVSEEVAQGELDSFLDWCDREREPRLDMLLFLAPGRTAAEFFEHEEESDEAKAILLYNVSQNKEISTVTVGEFLNMTVGEEKTPWLTVAGKDTDKSAGVFLQDGSIRSIKREDRTAFYLMLGRFREAREIIKTEKGNFTLHLTGAKRKVEMSPEGVHYRFEVEAGLRDIGFPFDPYVKEQMADLEKQSAEQLKKEIDGLIAWAQKGVRTDIFGLGERFSKYQPAQWEEMKEDWRERFPRLPISCEVSVVIMETGLTGRTMEPGEPQKGEGD